MSFGHLFPARSAILTFHNQAVNGPLGFPHNSTQGRSLMARVQLHRFVESSSKPAQRSPALDRRGFLAAAAGLAATTAMAPDAFARNFGPGAEPQRYPDPDIVVLDKRFKYKIGNTPIQRLYTGMLWAEGPGLERRRPVSALERHPQRRAAALAGRGRPRQRLPQSGRQQQRQHLRLRGPADRLRARQPPRRALRAQRQASPCWPTSSRASRSTRPTTRSCIPTAARSGSPIRATAS